MIKRILVILSLVALVAGNFATSPIVATPSSTTYAYGPIILFDCEDEDFGCEYGTIWIDDGDPWYCTLNQDEDMIFTNSMGPVSITMLSGNIPNAFSYAEIEITTYPISSWNQPINVQVNNSTVYSGTCNFKVYGDSFDLFLYGNGDAFAQHYLKITATLHFTAPILSSIPSYYLDGSGLTMQDNYDGTATIFDGVFYLNSNAEIDIALDMLASFVCSYGWITSFNVSAPGLWIEVQGLYQQAYGYEFISFFDWIGESPTPRGPSEEEEELNYYWYIDFSGSAGWYDLQIYVEYF